MQVLVPYHCLQICGDTILAAQGANILSLSADGSHLSTWRHPADVADGGRAKSENGSSALPSLEGRSGPPAKRRKVEGADEESELEQDPDLDPEAEDDVQASVGTPKEAGNGNKKTKKKQKNGGEPRVPKTEDRPFIQALATTTDGHHVAAITGSDKTLWVFENDGAGKLKQLSQR